MMKPNGEYKKGECDLTLALFICGAIVLSEQNHLP